MLPNFICPGAQKAATSTLFQILRQHPDIYLPKHKETHFFDREERFSQGIDWYQEEYYGDVGDEKIIGDMTPEYMYLPYIPQRIYDCLGPSIKFIFLFRNPVGRAYSHYQMSVRRGCEDQPFYKAILLEDERCAQGPEQQRNFSYIERGYYAAHLQRYLALFPRENMRFFLFEEMTHNTPQVVEDILAFLGLEACPLDYQFKSNTAWEPRHSLMTKAKKAMPSLIPKGLKKHIPDSMKQAWQKLDKKPAKRKVDLDTRTQLINKYREDITKLETLIQKDLSSWLRVDK